MEDLVYMKKIPSFLLIATILTVAFPQLVHAAGISGAVWSGLSYVAGKTGDFAAWALTPVFAFLAMLLIWMIGWLLMFTGALFHALIKWTIVDFGQTMAFFGIMSGIERVWTAFRDISNIIIIGMFVFVAIMTILGSQNYGVKRFIVRILLISILINFSLLFTKLMIDFSHIAALQFYKGIVRIANTTGPAAAGGTAANPDNGNLSAQHGGVAGAFLTRAGLTSGFDTREQLNRVAARAGGGMKGLMVMWSYAFTLVLFMLGLIVSFIFASYLLASRAILLIFLMLTSSLAFASYLIPGYGESKQFGFAAWKDALIKNVVFAPMIMMFLWASLTILQPRSGGGTLGDFFDKPGNPDNWSALIAYLLAAGLLFLSIKFSASFASSIPHFNLAAKLPALGAVGGAFLGAKLGRTVIGGSASVARAGAMAVFRNTKGPTSDAAYGIATRLGSLAKRDYNFMRTSIGKNIAGTAGLKGGLAAGGAKIGGYDGAVQKAAEKAATKAAAGAKTPAELEAILKKAREDNAKTAPGKDAHDAHAEAESRLAAAQKERADSDSAHEMQLANIRSKLANAATTPAERKDLVDQAGVLERQKGILAKAETAKIAQAQKQVTDARTALDTLVMQRAKEMHPPIDVDRDGKLTENKVKKAQEYAEKRLAGKIYKGFETILGKKLDPVVSAMGKKIKDMDEEKDIGRLINRMQKSMPKDEKAAAPAAPSPAATKSPSSAGSSAIH